MEKKVPMQPHGHLSVQIHENEGGPPPAIPRGMSGEKKNPEGERKRTMTPAERQKAYRARRKLQNKLGL